MIPFPSTYNSKALFIFSNDVNRSADPLLLEKAANHRPLQPMLVAALAELSVSFIPLGIAPNCVSRQIQISFTTSTKVSFTIPSSSPDVKFCIYMLNRYDTTTLRAVVYPGRRYATKGEKPLRAIATACFFYRAAIQRHGRIN